jgi:hypothetical protein
MIIQAQENSSLISAITLFVFSTSWFHFMYFLFAVSVFWWIILSLTYGLISYPWEFVCCLLFIILLFYLISSPFFFRISSMRSSIRPVKLHLLLVDD